MSDGNTAIEGGPLGVRLPVEDGNLTFSTRFAALFLALIVVLMLAYGWTIGIAIGQSGPGLTASGIAMAPLSLLGLILWMGRDADGGLANC